MAKNSGGRFFACTSVVFALPGRPKLRSPATPQILCRFLRPSNPPARSIGPALIGVASHPGYVAQLWLFIVAPLVGAGAAGFLFKESALLDAKRG